MPRMTTDERRINYMCGEIGFTPENVYEFTKMMLIEYKMGRDLIDIPRVELSTEEIRKGKQDLRREFLEIMKKPYKEALECYKDFVLKVVNASWFDEKVVQILDEVSDFRNVGEIYRDILETCYFSDTPLTNERQPRLLE